MKAEEFGVEIYPGFAASEVLVCLALMLNCLAYRKKYAHTSYVILIDTVCLQILYGANNSVIGIGTNDMGIAKDGSKKENFQHGVELKGRSSSFYLSMQTI